MKRLFYAVVWVLAAFIIVLMVHLILEGLEVLIGRAWTMAIALLLVFGVAWSSVGAYK